MKQIDITNKNKDLDLRRFGKGVYTKKSGSGGDSDGDNVLSGVLAFELSMKDKRLQNMGSMLIDQYKEQAEDYGLVPNYTYGNSETASAAMLFMSEQGPEGDVGVAFLTEKEYKAYSDTVYWNFNYFCNYYGATQPQAGANVVLQDLILMSDTLPLEWEGIPEIPVEQGYNFTIYGNISNPLSLESLDIREVITNILNDGGSVSLIADENHNNGVSAVMKVIDPYTHKAFYTPVSTEGLAIGVPI